MSLFINVERINKKQKGEKNRAKQVCLARMLFGDDLRHSFGFDEIGNGMVADDIIHVVE